MNGVNNDVLKLEWLGINSFRFEYRGRIVLLDPYVSRNRDSLCEPEIVRRYIPKADYIVISHSHWDHLADTPEIAKYTNAKIIGSETTCNVCASFGIAREKLINAEAFANIDGGDFNVTFFPSLHMPNKQGLVTYAGVYKVPPEIPPESASDYLEGNTFAVLFEFGETRILNIGSANVIEKHLLDTRPSVLILSIAGWEKTPRFIERIMDSIQPKMVIPSHYDTLDQPLGRGLTDRFPVATERFLRTVKKLAPAVKVEKPGYFEKIFLS